MAVLCPQSGCSQCLSYVAFHYDTCNSNVLNPPSQQDPFARERDLFSGRETVLDKGRRYGLLPSCVSLSEEPSGVNLMVHDFLHVF